jgi:hypothetical protein
MWTGVGMVVVSLKARRGRRGRGIAAHRCRPWCFFCFVRDFLTVRRYARLMQ